MTALEMERGTKRLEELERRNLLPEETLRDLRAWWRKTVYDETHKVVSLEAYRARRAYLP